MLTAVGKKIIVGRKIARTITIITSVFLFNLTGHFW